MMSQNENIEDRIRLSVIVLFYHGERWIQDCIQSLQHQSLPGSMYELILVNNGGSTPSVGNYDGLSNVKVLHFSKNYGFAGGNNKALAHAAGEFILLMNQDVVVHYNCLEELMTAAADNPNAGVISANMLMISSKTIINRYVTTGKSVGLYKLTCFGYAAYSKKQLDSPMVPVEFISGNGMFFRKDILKDVGNYLFDHRLKSYAEDLDLSIRIKKTKWKMYVRRGAIVYHYRDVAFSGRPFDRLRKLIHVSSNRLWVYYNNLLLGKFLINLPLLLLGIPLKVARPDGYMNFHFIHFSIALLMVPFVFINFCFKALKR